MLKPMLVIPDEDYSQPGYIRVFYYSRSNILFSQFYKQEYLVPEAELTAVINAILIQPQNLKQYNHYQQNTQ